MAFIPTLGCIRAAVHYAGYSKPVFNVLHFAATNPVTTEQYEAIGDMLEDVFTEAWESAASQEVTIPNIELRDMSVDDGTVFDFIPSTALQGIAVAVPPPVNTCGVISWRSGLAGRSQRGRTYLPGIPFQYISGKLLTPSSLSFLQTFGDTLIEAAAEAGHALQVVSFRHNNAPRVAGLKTPVTIALANPSVGTQRRRV